MNTAKAHPGSLPEFPAVRPSQNRNYTTKFKTDRPTIPKCRFSSGASLAVFSAATKELIKSIAVGPMSIEETSVPEPVPPDGSTSNYQTAPIVDTSGQRRNNRHSSVDQEATAKMFMSLFWYALATLFIWLGIFVFAYFVTLHQTRLLKVPDGEGSWLGTAQAWGEASCFTSALISGFALGALIVTFVWQFRQASQNQRDMNRATGKLDETAKSLTTTASLLRTAIDQLSNDAKKESLSTIISALTTMIHESGVAADRDPNEPEWRNERDKALGQLRILVNKPPQTESASTP